MIAWRKAKILQFNRRIQRGQHGTGSSKQVGLKSLWGLTSSDLFGPLTLKTTYHSVIRITLRYGRQGGGIGLRIWTVVLQLWPTATGNLK